MSMAPSGAATLWHLARITDAAAVYSPTLSPRVRSAINNPPIWLGVASPSNSRVKARVASSGVSGRSAAAPISGFSASLMPAP